MKTLKQKTLQRVIHAKIYMTLIIINMTLLLAGYTMFVIPKSFAQDDVVQGLSVTLETVCQEYEATDAFNLKFSLTNTSETTINVLTWNTPLDGFNSDMFVVTRAEERIPYLGRMVKRGAPRPEDYVTIAPEESVFTVIDIGEAYAIYDAGEYAVQFQSGILDVGTADSSTLAEEGALVYRTIQSDVVIFQILTSKSRPQDK